MRLLALLVVILCLAALPGVTPVGWHYLPNMALLVAATASLKRERGAAVLLGAVAGLTAGLCDADPIAFRPLICLATILVGQLMWTEGRGRAPLMQVLAVVVIASIMEWAWRAGEWGGVGALGSHGQHALHAGITLLFCPIAVALSEPATS